MMPFRPDVRKETEKLANVIGQLIYPALISVNLPAFLYTIVLEKEQRLIMNMRINGLAMRNYWIVNFFYNLTIYIITTTAFYAFGYFVSELSFFTETNQQFVVAALFGWGLNQVSLALLISCFLS